MSPLFTNTPHQNIKTPQRGGGGVSRCRSAGASRRVPVTSGCRRADRKPGANRKSDTARLIGRRRRRRRAAAVGEGKSMAERMPNPRHDRFSDPGSVGLFFLFATKKSRVRHSSSPVRVVVRALAACRPHLSAFRFVPSFRERSEPEVFRFRDYRSVPSFLSSKQRTVPRLKCSDPAIIIPFYRSLSTV